MLHERVKQVYVNGHPGSQGNAGRAVAAASWHKGQGIAGRAVAADHS